MQDDKGKTVQYDKRGFLVWDNAGVSAVRNEENAYNISAIYLWVTENKESVRNLPAPTGVLRRNCSGGYQVEPKIRHGNP